jgi:hypothetical protein
VRGFRRWLVLAIVALAAIAGAGAQSDARSQSVTIQIVAVVPAVLRLSLDFSPDGCARLNGYVPGAEALGSDASYSRSEGTNFEIKAGTKVELGNARLFSNVMAPYSIHVYSANGGSLRDPRGAAKSCVPYRLCLGDSVAAAQGGVFSFAASGKSSKDNAPLMVALAISDVPPAAVCGYYTDQLMFSVSAN